MIVPDGVRLIGGEMIDWSDAGRDLPGGAALAALVLGAVPAGGNVLVAGPHAPELVSRLAGHCARVTCLLRSLPDATELQRSHAGTTSGRFTVLCGGLDSLAAPALDADADPEAHAGGRARRDAGGPFDAVVALSGLQRLTTPDGPQLSWEESLRRLMSALAPGGSLVLAVENELGLHRLVDPVPAETADGQWFPPYGVDTSVPAGPAELVRRAAVAGGGGHRCYAVYPCLDVPAVLLRTDLIEERLAADGVAAALVSAALGEGFAGRPVLFDPRRLARTSLAQGLGAHLAPGWIAVLNPAGDLPHALVSDGPGPMTVTCELTEGRGPGGTRRWERALVEGPETALAGRIVRDPARLAGPVPAGRMLEQLLLTACALADLPALRGLLRSYAAWLNEQPPAVQPFATPSNVVVSEDRTHSLLDPSWELAEPMPYASALARALRGFAVTLLAGGHRHPWPTTLDVEGITAVLLAMAGRRPDQAVIAQAVRLEAEIIASRRGVPLAEREQLIAEVEAGLPPEPMGWREALLERERLAADLAEARDRGVWLDATLQEKEAKLTRVTEAHARLRAQLDAAQEQLQELRESVPFRMVRLVVAPSRRFRRAVREARPSRPARPTHDGPVRPAADATTPGPVPRTP